MAALTLDTDFIITPGNPQFGVKKWIVQSKTASAQNDTFAFDLPSHGISSAGLLAVKSFVHTTVGSIIVLEADTTAVASGVLTITMTSANTRPRVFYIVGRSKSNIYA